MANQEAINLWLKHLEENPPQTRAVLRDVNGYCCLGVACNAYHEATGLGYWKENGNEYKFVTEGGSDSLELPDAVRDWLDIDGSNNPHLGEYRASEYNDGSETMDREPETFAEIAERIRKEFF